MDEEERTRRSANLAVAMRHEERCAYDRRELSPSYWISGQTAGPDESLQIVE
jgi:hypothetical protein